MSDKWKLVPIEPTDEMMRAGCAITCKEPCYADCKNNGSLRAQYQAMLNAAPTPNNITTPVDEYEQLLEKLLPYKLKIMPDIDGDVHYVSCSIRMSISPHIRKESLHYFYKAKDMSRCSAATLKEATITCFRELAEAVDRAKGVNHECYQPRGV